MNQEQEQEKLANTVADVIKTGVTVGAQLAAIPRSKPVKIKINTAKNDVDNVRQMLKRGESKTEIAKIVSQSDTAKRISKNGGDIEQYTGLILQKAELDNAVEKMPSQAQNQVKTRKKTL